MTDQMPKPTGLSKPTVGDDDFFNQDFTKFGQPEKNLEVGGGDLAVGLAGSATRGVGTGIAEIGLSDLLRAGAAISDKLPGSQIADVVSRKINGWTEDEQAAKKADVINKIASVTTDPIDNNIVKPVVNPIGTAIKKGGEALIENGTSDDYKEALRGRELFTGDGVSDFAISDSAGDPAVWAAKLTDGIGSLGGTLAVGALTGGTVKNIVKRQMLKRGASMELADETARLAGIKWGQRGAMAEGVNMSTGQSADQARSQVDALSWDQLLTSKTFNDQVKEISRDPQFEGASGTDLLNEAKRRTGDFAASIAKSDPKTWAAAAAGTLLGDAALFKMLQGTGAKGVAAGALQGMAGEGVGEAIEEGTQQYIGNEAANEAGGQNIDPMEGVLQAAATAGTIGALTGGAVGAVGGARGSMAPQEDTSTNEVTAPDADASSAQASAIPAFDVAISEVQGIERKLPGQHAIGRDGDKYRAAYVDEMGNVQVTPAYGKVEDVRTAMGFKAPAQPAESASPGSAAPLNTGSPAVDEFAEIPAYQRQDGGRVKGFAEDSEVQRALAGEFGPSVAELVKRQVDAGEQGPTAQEKPFVDALNAPLALPNKDIIFAGDVNAKLPGTEVAPPGAFDDKPAGPGPQFRGAERTRWQDGQEGEVLPPDAGGNPFGALPGRVIDGEAREVGTELPYKPFIAGQDNRAAVSEEQRRQAEQSAMAEQQQNQPKQIGQSDTIFAPGAPGSDNKNSAYTPPRLSRDQVDNTLGEQSTRDPRSPVAQAIEQSGSEQDSIFGQLKTLRITKRGKPFASQKEAQLASRKTETPIELPAGGFGVVDKAELEQVQASQAPVKQPSSNAGQLEQSASQEVTDGMPQQLPETLPVLPQTRPDSLPPADGVAPEQITAPAPDAGVAVSGVGKQRITIEPLTDKSIIVKGDKNDTELKARVEAAWPKAPPLYNERYKGWVFSSKREGVVREALADLVHGDVGEQSMSPVVKAQPKESPVVAQIKPAMTNKLRDTGKTLINLGRDKANQPRQTNTPKRAGQAASAIRDAESMQADGETLIKIADAVDNGEAPHLSRLSSKAQYQTLDQLHRRAIPSNHMEGGEYRGHYEGTTERRRKSGITVDDYADQIQYPTITAHPDRLRSAANALGEIRGYKGLADKLNYAARLVTNSDRYQPAVLNEETAKALTKAAKDTGNREVKLASEHVESGVATIDRLRRMGIDNRDQLVEAIKELDAIQVPRKQESRLQQLERGLVGNKIPGYFNTQGEALKRVMAAAGVKPGDEVLEPSAGKGNIADAAKQAGAKVDTVERHNTLREILQEKGHSLVGNDFTTLDASKQYDKVIMNPPFEQQQDIDHVRKAWGHIKPGGRLVAVMSAGVEGNSNRKATEFRQWLDDNGGKMERLPDGSFKDSDRSTGVNTVMVVLDKPISKETNKPASTGLRGSPQGVVTKESIARYQADEAQKAADNRRREQEAVGSDYPELNELVAVYGKPTPSVTETRKAAESRVKVSNAIKAAKGLDESYRFDKLIDSNWQSDRDQALALAKEVYAEGDGKTSETNVGEISHDVAKLIGRQAGKVILRDGDEAAGRIHIQMRHGDQISAVGFKSVGDFVAHVVGEPTAIYKGNGRGLYLVKEEKPYGLAIVQLEPSDNGDFYDVKTATPMRKDQFKNKEPLYVFAGPSKQSTEVDPLNPKGKSDSSTQSITNGVIDKKTANQRQKETSISDFGEKIGGARKDVWTSYRDSLEGNTAEQIAELPLSKAWPAPDYQKMIDSGVDARAVGLMRAAREAIPSKPRAGYKVKSWASSVKELRDLSMQLLDGSLDPDVVGRMMERSSLRSANNIINKAELYQAVGHQRSLADLTLEDGEYSMKDGVHYSPPKKIWSMSREGSSTAFGNWPRMFITGDTKEQVIAEFRKRYDQLTGEKAEKKAVTFDIYSDDRRASWVVGKKVGRNYIPLSKPFENVADARRYREENYDALVAELEKRKAIPNERRDINQPRVGEDMRSGADVTPEMFSNAFGFRGVEFGNWVEGSRRQRDLNDAYDALMDMAAILNIHPKAISLNGQLGLAFGARGSGGVSPAAAHYEPGKVVINLTKMNGAGSLGHEWWHALDNYFGRMRGDSGSMSDARDVGLAARGSNYVHRGEVRKEMVDAFGAVKRAIDQTAIKARSSKLDGKRSKEYWTTDKEMSARAFESYLISKLQDQGVSNDYLANIASEETWDAMASLGFELDESYPYPTAGEIPAIRAGFDHLFDTIEQKEDGDRIALFSLSDAAPSTRGMTKPELEMVATDWSKQYKGAASARIMVAANQAEMNEVLGMVGAAMPDGQTINAAYLPGYKTLLLNAEAIQSPKRARELMRHELLAHHGLREVVGDDAYISIIEAVKRGKDIKGIKDAYYQVAENYTDMHPDVQAEEVFAHWMEQQPDRGELAIWWRGIVRRVKDALRAVGLVGERTTEEEFNRVLDAIATGMRNGRKPGRRVMESWHDAPAYSMRRDPFKPDTFDARAFADEVDAVYRSGTSPRHQLRIGDTPSIYVRLGAKNHELVMPASVVKKATNPADRSHNVAIEDIKRLPQLLSDPLAVMKSATENNALVSLVEALDMNNKPVIVAIHMDAKGDGFSEVNKVASVYGKDEVAALQRLLDNNLVYLNKEKAAWFHAAGLQLPGANYHGGLSKSVLTKDDIRNSGALFSLGANLADQSIIGKAESLAKAAPSSVLNWIKEQRGVGLGALTDLQIDQIYRGVTGGAVSRYQKLRTKMEADRNDILLDAETRIDPLWDSLGKEQKKALSNLMHDATMAKLHPDLSLADNSLYQEAKERLDKAVKPETKARYQDELNTIADNHKHLAERYNLGLNKEGKALYQTMRETYDKQWADLRDAIEQRLEDMMGAEGKTLAAELRLQMEHALKHGPYFPLARFGDYVVKASKGDEHIREHFERRKDAEQAIEQYQRDGYNAVMTVKEEGNGGQANSNALGMKVMQLLDKAGESGASASAIKDDVWQAMLQMLPDASFAKHAIHRRRVKGASRDGHRAYLNSVYHYAHHVSKIRYGHKMQAELNKMNEQIQSGVRGEESDIKPGDLEVAQQVLNEMNKRHELNMNPKGAKWTGWAGNLGFMWYMAGSPASAIINMTQNFTVMLPQLGAKYGFVKASAAMAKALHDYAKHGKFKAGTKEAWVSLTRADSGITRDEKELLNSLYKAGALDLTQAHSVAARADTDLQDVKPGAAWKRKTMAWLGSMFHNAEVLNREVAALAAYRLLKSADPSLSSEQYADKVTEMVYDGHGNYAASNRPRYMRGDVAKVLTQFKIYSQMMTYTIYRNAYLAAKGDKVALKTLGGVLGTHFIMAGMMGLPYPVTAALYAIAAAADDDDDRTGEASFRLGLVETLGTGLGELVARGPMDAMTGLSIAGRTGINALWYREPEDGAEGDDLAWHVTQQIVGPVPGIFTQALRGLSMMGNGDYQRGAETMMPKAMKDLAKAYRQFNDGERTRKGDVIIDDVSAFNLAMQAMGFSNAEMAKVYDAREYIKGKEGRIEDERSKLMSDYFMARKDGDEEAMAEVMVQIREFNASHYRTEAITSRTLRQSIKSKQRSAHRTQGGVYLSRNREYLRGEGAFIGDGGTATN